MKPNRVPYSRYSPIGLDVASRSLRAVQLRGRGSAMDVHAALEIGFGQEGLDDAGKTTAPVEPSASNESVEKNHNENLLRALKQLGQHPIFRGRAVILHCPADKLDLRPVALPSGPDGLVRDAILGALKLQLNGHLGFPIEHAVLDYYQTGYDAVGKHLRIMAVAADGRWIKRRMEFVASAGFECVGIDALPWVLGRLVENNDYYPEASPAETAVQEGPNALFALLDMGFGGSTLVVRDAKGPIFSRCFGFGGEKLTGILSERMSIHRDSAEHLKQAYGLDYSASGSTRSENSAGQTVTAVADFPASETSSHYVHPEISRTIYTVLRHELNQFVETLARSLNYIINEYRGCRLERILLCGRTSHTANLAKFLTEQYDLPVECLRHRLLEAITACQPASRSLGGLWTTALGLALQKEGV